MSATPFWTVAAKYPPILCRLLARHKNGPPLTTLEIVERCAMEDWPMSAYYIGNISASLDWDQIPFGVMRAFTRACGIDFCDRKSMNRIACYMKLKHRFLYLRKSPEFDTVLRPLVASWRAHIEKQIK